MTEAEPPAPPRSEVPAVPSAGSDLVRAVPVAIRRGLAVSLAAILLGQVPPLVMNLGGGGLAIATQVRLGWFYTAAANAASIRVGATPAGGGALDDLAQVRIVVLTFTAIVLWMLTRAGGATARQVADRPVRRAMAGALVAIPYAIPLVVMAAFVELRLETGGGFLPDVTTISTGVLEVSVLTLGFGAVAGALGGSHASAWWSGPLGDVLAAGWRILWVGLVASLVGLLAFAALRPEGLDAYVQELRSLGTRGAGVTVGHQFLMLPNHATLVLVPAMGACDTVTVNRESFDAVCLDRLPDAEDPADWLSAAIDDRPGVPTTPAPWTARLFLLVPLLAVIVGVRRASVSTSVGAAIAAALGSAVVFGALMAAVTWASTVEIMSNGVEGEKWIVALGAHPVTAAGYAVVWGMVVGIPTACVSALVRRRRPAGVSPASLR